MKKQKPTMTTHCPDEWDVKIVGPEEAVHRYRGEVAAWRELARATLALREAERRVSAAEVLVRSWAVDRGDEHGC